MSDTHNEGKTGKENTKTDNESTNTDAEMWGAFVDDAEAVTVTVTLTML